MAIEKRKEQLQNAHTAPNARERAVGAKPAVHAVTRRHLLQRRAAEVKRLKHEESHAERWHACPVLKKMAEDSVAYHKKHIAAIDEQLRKI